MAFRGLRTYSRGLRILLVVYMVALTTGAAVGLLQLELLGRIDSGGGWTEEEADFYDLREFLVASLGLVVYVATAIVFLRWLFLSSRNAHAVTPGMRYTPGWTVGWYFVPIFNFWKPYQAMAELFRASDPSTGANWRFASRPGILVVWWSFWLLSYVVNNVVFRILFGKDTVQQLIHLTRGMVTADLVDLALSAVAFVLVGRLTVYQETKFGAARQSAAW